MELYAVTAQNRYLALAAALASLCLASPSIAQKPADQALMALIAPDVPPGDSSDRIANTKFVQQTIAGGGLPFLPLAGGTMSGPIAMGGNNISGFGAATGTSLALGGATIGGNALAVLGPISFPNNSLTLAEFPTIGANTVLGSIAGGTPAALSQAQLTSLISNLSQAQLPGLSSGNFWLGNGSGAAAQAAMSGDCTMSSAGVISCIGITSINPVPFITPGAVTYTPSQGMKFVWARCVGAGGAGGGTPVTTSTQVAAGGGGGGAGGYTEGLFTAAQIGASQTVTIGTGGAPVTGASGGNGSATTFGALLTATGGTGGPIGVVSTASTVAGGAASGSGSGGFLNIVGQTGWDGWGIISGTVSLVQGGPGGMSPLWGGFGTPAMVPGPGSINGINGNGAGSGGSGASAGPSSATTNIGGTGRRGECQVVEYISQ
jgi:hypothetical protein